MTTLHEILDPLSNAPTFEQQLQSLASFASIALALLTAFTTRRSAVLDEDSKQGIPMGLRSGAAPDIVLALATLLVLVTMFPPFRRSFSVGDWLDSAHTLRSMFSLIYLGFIFVLMWQLTLIVRRVKR